MSVLRLYLVEMPLYTLLLLANVVDIECFHISTSTVGSTIYVCWPVRVLTHV